MIEKPITDAETGEQTGTMFLLPPAKDKCQVCASKHEPAEPHNAQSLYYQTVFNMEHGRAATWLDAMEHCAPELQEIWTKVLEDRGVDVKGGGINPAKR